MLVLLLLVLARQMYPYRFEDFTSLFTSGKFMAIKSREHKALFGFNVIMLFVHLLSLSVFIFVFYRTFIETRIEETEIVFLRIFTATSFLILLKITVEKIIANVFDIDDTIENYLFQKHTYLNFISLGILIISIFLVYAHQIREWIFYIVGALFLGAIILSFIRIIAKNQRLVTHNLFYFILYLCALEIAPYVILYKLVVRG